MKPRKAAGRPRGKPQNRVTAQPFYAEPEAAMQERGSFTASALMLLFLAGFWVQDRWHKISVGLRCCAAPINRKHGAAQQHGPTKENNL